MDSYLRHKYHEMNYYFDGTQGENILQKHACGKKKYLKCYRRSS